MTECFCTSVIFTSFIDVPSLVCVDSRNLNWPTSSCVFPFIHKCWKMVLALFSFLSLDEAVASRAVIVIVSGSVGWTETLLEQAK